MRVDHRRLHIRVPEVFAPGPQGEPLQKIARFAGHSSTHVTELFYAHLHPEHLKGAAGVIDSVLGTFLTNLVTTCPPGGTDADPPHRAQAPDTIARAALIPFRAGVAKLADARDSKSCSLNGECGFDSLLRHQFPNQFERFRISKR